MSTLQDGELRMEVTTAGRRTDLSVSGVIDGANAHVFEEFVALACSNGTSVVVLDLSRCESVDRSGLASLARLFPPPPTEPRILIGRLSDAVAAAVDASCLALLLRFAHPEVCPACDRVPSAQDVFCAECGSPVGS